MNGAQLAKDGGGRDYANACRDRLAWRLFQRFRRVSTLSRRK
jgi:hypothetical protein